MADEFTTTLGVPGDKATEQAPIKTEENTSVSDLPTPPARIDGFSGQPIEPSTLLNLAPSPADQRILSAPPHTDPLPVLADRAVKGREDGDGAGVDLEAHRGGSLTEDSLPGETPLPVIPQWDTPVLNADEERVPVQHTDVPPPNDIAIDEEGATVTNEGEPYPGLDTKEYNESIEARLEAEEEGTRPQDLPEIKPAVPGEGITANDVGVPEEDQGEDTEPEGGVSEEITDETPDEGSTPAPETPNENTTPTVDPEPTPVTETPNEETTNETPSEETTPTTDTPNEETTNEGETTPTEGEVSEESNEGSSPDGPPPSFEIGDDDEGAPTTPPGEPDPVAEKGPLEPSADASVPPADPTDDPPAEPEPKVQPADLKEEGADE